MEGSLSGKNLKLLPIVLAAGSLLLLCGCIKKMSATETSSMKAAPGLGSTSDSLLKGKADGRVDARKPKQLPKRVGQTQLSPM